MSAKKAISTAGEKKLEIPWLLKELNTTIALITDSQGFVIDCNRGFNFLISSESELKKNRGQAIIEHDWNVRDCFVQPAFSDLVLFESQRIDEPVYQGILNIGDPDHMCRSITGSVYRHDNKILLIGEHDIADLEKLSSSVVELNNELAQAQRNLVKANRDLKRNETKIIEMMLTDPMTEIANRRHFSQKLEEEFKRHIRIKQPFCLAMGDIDLFKQVNDTYGHDVGDTVICQFAHAMRDNKRDSDFVARVGGEEFIMLLPHTEISQAKALIDRIRAVFSDMAIENIEYSVTASFGITQLRDGDTAEDIIKRADQCLYKAKENGRNQVSIQQ